jgi:hypothetical protein
VSFLAASRKTEVSQFNMATTVKENIVRFDVSGRRVMSVGVIKTTWCVSIKKPYR